MAGVSTPAMAAAVTGAGGLGAMALGHMDVQAAETALQSLRSLTRGPININVFCHRPPVRDLERERRWLDRLRPFFAEFGAEPPTHLREIYRSFIDDRAMLELLVEEAPAVISFHFGLPPPSVIGALKARGICLLASVTNLIEGRAAAAAGVDALVAQGFEAGGHRGVFDTDLPDPAMGTLPLVRILLHALKLPVIAAGGIMDGSGIAAAGASGAVAAQLGTAFILTDESEADRTYRAAVSSEAARHTIITRSISGRPARGLRNRLTALDQLADRHEIPAYPLAYDAGKALNVASRARGETGFAAYWAGQGAPLARPLGSAELVATLVTEMEAALAASPMSLTLRGHTS
jgi:nitronate monooxygenase